MYLLWKLRDLRRQGTFLVRTYRENLEMRAGKDTHLHHYCGNLTNVCVCIYYNSVLVFVVSMETRMCMHVRTYVCMYAFMYVCT